MTQTIKSGVTTEVGHFIADSGLLTTPGLGSFTVTRKRGSNAAANMTLTSGDIVEDGTTGFYAVKFDEDMTITGGKKSEPMTYRIQCPGMATQIIRTELRANYDDDVLAILGTPAGASIAADIAAAMTRLGAPAGASLAADTAAIFSRIGAPVLASISADVASVLTRLGSPAGASVSVDIAAVTTSVSNVFSRLGAPAGASTAADIAAIFARLGAPAGASTAADIAAVATAVANVFARLGAPAGASTAADISAIATAVANVFARLGAPAGASTAADIAAVSTAVATVNSKIGTPAVTVSTDIATVAGALASGIASVLSAIAGLDDLSAAQVKAQVVAALAADVYSEPAGVPAASATLAVKIGVIFAALRDGIQIDGNFKVFLDQSGVPMWKKALTDGGGTYLEATAAPP
jgi:hypothetical protein